MIKTLSLTFIFFLALITPVKESSVSMLEELNVSKLSKKIKVKTEEELLISKSEELDISRNFEEEVENNSGYSPVISAVSYIEVKKAPLKEDTSVKTIKTAVVNVKLEALSVRDESGLSYEEVQEQTYNKQKLTVVAHSAFKFNLREYDSINNTIEDRISTAVAANEKSSDKSEVEPDLLKAREYEGTHDELVFFNYKEDGKVSVVNNNVSAPKTKLSEKLKVVAPASHQQKVSQKPLPLLDNQKILNLVKGSNKSKSGIDYSKRKAPKSQKLADYKSPELDKKINELSGMQSLVDDTKKPKDYRCMQTPVSRNVKSEYSLSLIEIDYSKNEYQKLHNFDLEFSDDGSRLSDESTGAIELNFNLNSNMNIRRGTLFNSRIYPLTTDFVFEGGSHKIELPAFEKETFNSIIKNLGITGFGGHILVQLDDTTENIDLDIKTKYQAKVFLNNNLEIIDRGNSEYSYILYIGVDTGNTIISFKNNKNEVTTKIIHIAEDEIYFDPNFYAEVMDDEVSFYQENLTTQCKSLLNIDTQNINPWSFKTKKSKKTLNMIGFDRMIYPLGTRKYYELSHLEESIYVGKWSEASIVVPTESYARHVLESLEVAENNCMVQLNNSKKILELNYNGISSRNEIRPEVSYLDNDGIFYDEVSPDTKKVFIKGEEQGLLNIKLKYIDGSTQFIQTFCSSNTYLVEQL